MARVKNAENLNMISQVRATFLEKIKRTEGVYSFRFKMSEKVDFVPGQFAEIIFDEKDRNNRQLNKYLSFSSAPDNDYVEFTKRISDSSFSEKLKILNTPDTILIKAPLGNCVFKDEYKKIGFLIGGIGITPVISILEYIVTRKLTTDVCLMYSNRTETDIAFKDKIDSWANSNENINVSYTITDCKPQDAYCLYGAIDHNMLAKQICDTAGRIFYIFGPPGMVLAMKHVCSKVGCQEDSIKSENFIGY
jgi:ferredoxin-NADP reductase